MFFQFLAETSHAVAEGGHGGGASFGDATLWALITLLALIGVFVYLKVPQLVLGTLDKRADDIQEELDKARELREEAAKLLADTERKAQDAEKEAAEILDRAKADAEQLSVKAKADMDERIKRREALAEAQIARAESEAYDQVKAAATEAAFAAVENLMASGKADDLLESSIGQVEEALKAQ